MSTGIKRPRELVTDELPYGSDSERSTGRRDVRRKDEGNARDWRDAHLNAGRDRKTSYTGRSDDRSSERRDGAYRSDHRPPRPPASPRDGYGRSAYGDRYDAERPGAAQNNAQNDGLA